MPHSRKSNLTGRVGKSTKDRRCYQNVSVAFPKVEEKNIEEVAPAFGNYFLYDEHGNIINDPQISLDNFDSASTRDSLEDKASVEEKNMEYDNFVGNSVDVSDTTAPLDKDVVVTKVTKRKKSKKRNLNFSKEEEEAIRGNDMLTDESINIAQNLLSKKFPQYEGFQDTVLGRVLKFVVIHPDKRYIQILSCFHNHQAIIFIHM